MSNASRVAIRSTVMDAQSVRQPVRRTGGRSARVRAAVIDATLGRGHVVLFSNNPFWRAETKGSYFLVFNAILNYDNLSAGRKLADK